MPINSILFYFASGMFITLLLFLGGALVLSRPSTFEERKHLPTFRRIGAVLLVAILPVVFGMFGNLIPRGVVFWDYLVAVVDTAVAVMLVWATCSFLYIKQFSYRPLFLIIIPSLAIFLFFVLYKNIAIVEILVAVWLVATMSVSVAQAVRHRKQLAVLYMNIDHFRFAWLAVFFIWNFGVNPFLLYGYLVGSEVCLFYVLFIFVWMSSGIVVLYGIVTQSADFLVDEAEVGGGVRAVNQYVTNLCNDEDFTSDRRTADDYFTPEQQMKMKARLEAMMNKDKIYRSPDLCVGDLVQRFDTNASYFYYFMRDVMHSSFFDYVNRFRVEDAKELLLQGEKVDYIVYRVGFNSDTTFRRAFKRATGLTPSEWRQHGQD